MEAFKYTGEELDVFEQAKNWKAYWSELVRPHMGQRILEVGAGTGSTTVALKNSNFARWVSTEPDASLCLKIEEKKNLGLISSKVEVVSCTIKNLPITGRFDTALYIDVLEHIEEDGGELAAVAELLDEGGKVIIVSPAYDFLYSPFDKKIGHFRRYNKKSINEIVPSCLKMKELKYLDSIGFFASLANKILLRTSDPTQSQIAFWDRYMIPLSRAIDPVICYSAGKSIMAVMEKR